MKKALISPQEITQENGKTLWRIVQVEPAENIFDVCEPLFWVDCADDIDPRFFQYDPNTNTIEGFVPLHQIEPAEPIGGAPDVIAD